MALALGALGGEFVVIVLEGSWSRGGPQAGDGAGDVGACAVPLAATGPRGDPEASVGRFDGCAAEARRLRARRDGVDPAAARIEEDRLTVWIELDADAEGMDRRVA